jgi:CubicO group peptidase (beta-lactamase class C family)
MRQASGPFCVGGSLDAGAVARQPAAMHLRPLIAAVAALAASPLAAQTAPAPTAQQRSLAAGYVALTTCSAIFNAQTIGAERSEASVRANELVGIYPELDPLVADMATEVGEFAVSVRWDERMPPRFARPDQVMGCTLYPVGTPVDVWLRPPALRQLQPQAPWPLGDDDFLRTEAEGRRYEPYAPPALFEVRNRAFGADYGEHTNTTAVVIVRGEEIVSERYAPEFETGTPQRTWSVAKSIAATIVGAAVHRGEVDVAAPAAIPNWQHEGDPRRAITLDQLLRMASGLTSDTAGNRTDAVYFGGTSVDEQVPGWPLIAPPGSTFRYANNDTLLAVMAISSTFARHPPHDFFASVSMHSTVAETDWRGNYILSSQVWATARDLARLGMLYLNDGVWNGIRILPENWLEYVSTPSGPQPAGEFGYGASFWLMNRSDGVPPDTIAAFGNRGQFVVIVPSRQVVIVRRGEDPAGARFDIAAFTRDVLAALGD